MGTELKYITLVVVNSGLMPVEVAVALESKYCVSLHITLLSLHVVAMCICLLFHCLPYLA